MRYLILSSLVTISLIFALGCSKLYPTYETKEVIEPTLHEELFVFTVTEILDGQSIKVHSFGKNSTITLSGIEIPKNDCMLIEKKERIKALLSNMKVALESDKGNKDNSTELFHYVWLPDGRMLNEILIKEGFAKIDTNKKNIKYMERLSFAQNSALGNNLGIWQICHKNN